MLNFLKKTGVVLMASTLIFSATACHKNENISSDNVSSEESKPLVSESVNVPTSQPKTVSSQPEVESSSISSNSSVSQSSSSNVTSVDEKKEYIIPDPLAIPDPNSEYIQRRTTEYYYKSSSTEIDIKQYKTLAGNSYWLVHITVDSPEQIFGGIANNEYGAARQKTSNALKANNWLLAINGSYFDYSTNKPKYVTSSGAEFYNPMIKNGVLIDNADSVTTTSLICIKDDGTIFSPENGLTGKELLDMGVKDCFMTYDPLMISDGIKQRTDVIKVGHPVGDKNYPRTAIGMVKPCEYYIIVAGDYTEKSGISFVKMQDIFYNLGCTYARSLDGGGSSTLAFNNQLINVPKYGSEREVVDFICFTD